MEITFRETLSEGISVWPLCLQLAGLGAGAHTALTPPARGQPILQVHGSRPLFLFYFFSPALPPEMILLGCLDDDDITSHYLLGRAFFQLTFFSCPKPHRASSQRAEVALGPPRGGASPLPSTSKSRMKIPDIQRFFFPPSSFSFL